MAVGAFPLIKLGALAIRQISKPLANIIKVRAKNSAFFRVYICMPPAQIYHYFDVYVRMRLLGIEKPANVKKLNEAAAIELGAELLGETIIFLIAVLTLSGEYYRQSKNANIQAAVIEERWNNIEKKVEDLEFLAEKQRTEIRELTRLVYSAVPANKSSASITKDSAKPSAPTNQSTKSKESDKNNLK